MAVHFPIANLEIVRRKTLDFTMGMNDFHPFHQTPGIAPMSAGIHAQAAPQGAGNARQKLCSGKSCLGRKMGNFYGTRTGADSQQIIFCQNNLIQGVGEADGGPAQSGIAHQHITAQPYPGERRNCKMS